MDYDLNPASYSIMGFELFLYYLASFRLPRHDLRGHNYWV
jgi:hypothetical protein